MATQVIIFLNLLVYSFIVSQSFSYIISLENVQKNLPVISYIEFRKLTDKNFRARFKWAFYAALITGPVAIYLAGKNSGIVLFISTIVSYIAFWTDAIIMIKGNLPINALMNTWTAENYPQNWMAYRDKWLSVFRLRQLANITGFISLLAGIVFG